MSPASSGSSVTGAKRAATPTVIDEYLASIPEPGCSTLSKVCETIRSVVPDGTSETITYRMPVWKYKGLLVGVVAYSNHCGLCVMNPSVMDLFQEEIAKLDTTKGTIRFPIDKPLPASFVKKLVKARIEQNESKKKR